MEAGIYIILSFIGFGLLWALTRRVFRRMRSGGPASGLGFEDLGSLQKHLSPEEYRRVRQKIVERVTQESREGGEQKSGLSLAELEAMTGHQQVDKDSGQDSKQQGSSSQG